MVGSNKRVGVCIHFVVMIYSGGKGVSCYAYEIFLQKLL